MVILHGAAGPSTRLQEKLLWATEALSSPGQRKISCLSRRKARNINPTTNPCKTNNPRLLLLPPCVVSIGPMFGTGERGLCPAVLPACLPPASPGTSRW